MKKLLVFSLTTLMILAFTITTTASTASLDYLMGSWEHSGADEDLTAITLGLEVPFDQFKIGFDYTTGTWIDTPDGDLDYSSYQIGFGYAVFNDDFSQLWINLDILGYNCDNGDIVDLTAYLISADWSYSFSDQSVFDVSLGISLSATDEDEGAGNDEVSLITAKLKYSYYFTESVGLGLGYSYLSGDYESGTDLLSSGFTLGMTFKF